LLYSQWGQGPWRGVFKFVYPLTGKIKNQGKSTKSIIYKLLFKTYSLKKYYFEDINLISEPEGYLIGEDILILSEKKTYLLVSNEEPDISWFAVPHC